MLDLTGFFSGGVGASLFGGLFLLFRLLVNKRLRTPSDDRAAASDAITERNELLAAYKRDVAEYKSEITTVKAALREAEAKIDALEQRMNERNQEWLHWGYAAAARIRTLGSEQDIPRPVPSGLRV